MTRWSNRGQLAIFYQDREQLIDACVSELRDLGDPEETLKRAHDLAADEECALFFVCIVPPIAADGDHDDDWVDKGAWIDEKGFEQLVGQPAPDLLTLRNQTEAAAAFRALGARELFGNGPTSDN